MGDIKKPKKKYNSPSHPWQRERIEEEAILVNEYGFKNKKEIYKMRSILKSAADQAKKLIAATSEQAQKEQKLLIARLHRLGLIPADGNIDSILSLTIKDICERRFQTLVFRKGLARSVGQARQFITHGHVMVGDKVMSVPSYIVSPSEENEIKFVSNSTLNDPNHPERAVLVTTPEAEAKKKAKEERRKERAQRNKNQRGRKPEKRKN